MNSQAVKGYLLRGPLILLSLWLFLATGCAFDSQKRKVRNDFLRDHPDYKISSIGDPDGNDTTVVTFFIRYHKPNDAREYWSDRAYETKDGKFELVGKGSEHIYRAEELPGG